VVAALAAACDQRDPALDQGRGPPLHVVAIHPEPGAGTSCASVDGPECGVPRDITLELRFDRYLLPATAVRQAIALFAGDPENVVFFEPEYDMLERVLLYRLPEGVLLTPGLLYTLRIEVPVEPEDEGLRAFDGAPLEPGAVPLEFHFRTAQAEPTPTTSGRVVPEVADTCGIMDFFAGGGCGEKSCHGAAQRMGISLEFAEGVFRTAIGHVAHETAIGQSAEPLEEPIRLGVNMPIIDPGRPDNSYMLYKLIRREQNFGDVCESRYAVSLGGQCLEPPAPESVRLREWFVRGAPMPLDNPDAPLPSISYEDLRTLRRWIAVGASVDALQECP